MLERTELCICQRYLQYMGPGDLAWNYVSSATWVRCILYFVRYRCRSCSAYIVICSEHISHSLACKRSFAVHFDRSLVRARSIVVCSPSDFVVCTLFFVSHGLCLVGSTVVCSSVFTHFYITSADPFITGQLAVRSFPAWRAVGLHDLEWEYLVLVLLLLWSVDAI